ncbi:hypothetical protein BC30048_2938 [Bacillus cereus]|nr:hypothetical protein BC30048_2938 [Bacillus cereus]
MISTRKLNERVPCIEKKRKAKLLYVFLGLYVYYIKVKDKLAKSKIQFDGYVNKYGSSNIHLLFFIRNMAFSRVCPIFS